MKVALSYAEEFFRASRETPSSPWIEVPQDIKQQIEEKVKRFDGSLIELMELPCSDGSSSGSSILTVHRHRVYAVESKRYTT